MDFLMKLGQSKEDKLLREFTMIHNDTAFSVIQAVGGDAYSLWFALSTYARGKTGVYAYPKNETLMGQLGTSERSVQRWKQKLADAGIVRVIPCFRANGTQTANVNVLNAEFPTFPVGWDEFAQNGFVLIGGIPIPREELKKPAIDGVTDLTPYLNNPRKNCHPSNEYPDKTDGGRVSNPSPSPESTRAGAARGKNHFFSGEPDILEPENIKEAAYAHAREGEVISSSPMQTLGDEAPTTPRKPRLPKRIRVTCTYTKARGESDSFGDLSDAREKGGRDDLWRAVDQGQASPSEHDSFGELAPTAEVRAGGDLNPQDKPSPDQPGEPQGMAQMENLAISLLQRPLLTGDELHMIAELLEQGVPVATMVRGIQESFEAFVPRYTGDRIKRLTYCRDRIVELHEAATRPRSSPQKTTRKFERIGRESEPAVAPHVQPGKYDEMNERLARLVRRE